MIKALTKPRSPHFHRVTMFKIICFAALAGLFWTSAPARQMTADALDSVADFVQPQAETPGQHIDSFLNQFSN